MDNLKVQFQPRLAAGSVRSYTETGLDFLPQEWTIVRLEESARLRREGVDPGSAFHLPYVGLEHIDPGDTRLRRHGNASEVKSSKSHFYSGDVLYGKLRPYLDKAALAEQEGMCSTDILVLDPLAGVDPAFLSYSLHTQRFINHAVATTSGVNHPRTSWSSLREYSLHLPPLPEQQAIAHVLRTVQKAKEATEQVIKATRELKRSLMNHLFTYGPVPVDEAEQVPLKETEIGPVPEHWEVSRFEEMVEIARGQVKPTEEPYSKLPHVGPENIEAGTGRILPTKSAEELGLISGKYLFSDKHVLYSKIRPYLRKVALPTFEGICSADMYPVQPRNNQLTRGFLFYYLLNERFTVQAVSFQNRTGIPKINRTELGTTQLPVPPISEQYQIARVLSTVDEKIQAEENRKQTLDVLFKTLLHNLMTGKVRVKDLDFSEAEEMV